MKNVKKVIVLVMVLMSAVTTNVLAYTAYVGADPKLPQSYNRTKFVREALQRKGYSVETHLDDFTKPNILNRLKVPHVVYYDCHGGNSGGSTYFWDAGASRAIYPSDVKRNMMGFYNIVYFSACHTGETSQFANAFGINSNENKAFVGFKDTIFANWKQTMFDKTVFDDLAAGRNINDSVWHARTETGVTNYAIYGNYKAKLR